jgi:ABC-type multidrug transport system permease subunit
MNAFLAVYYREMLLLWRKFPKHVASLAVSPFLFILAFGYGLGDLEVGGTGYLSFLVPGLMAMGSMTQAFAMASEINISRFYWKIFEEIQAAPVSPLAYVLGEALAGVSRGLLATAIVLALALPFGVQIQVGPALLAAVILNSFLFACVAVVSAMLVSSHGDQALITSFVITPMAFLGGTFFPMDRMPEAVQAVLAFLPLTHAARIIRAAALGQPVDPFSFLILAVLGLAALGLAIWCVRRATD